MAVIKKAVWPEDIIRLGVECINQRRRNEVSK